MSKMAIINYSQVIKLKPDNADGYYQRAILFEDEKEYVYANEDFKTVRKLDPSNERAIMNLAVYSFERQLWEDAIKAFTKLLWLNPSNAIAYMYRGRALACRSKWDEALKDLTFAVQLAPNDPDNFFYRGCLLRERNVPKAIEDFSISILINNRPGNVDAYYQRGLMYCKLGQYNLAIADFATVIQFDPTKATAYLNLGNIYMRFFEDYTKALECFTKAIQYDPLQMRAYLCRGYLYQLIHKKFVGENPGMDSIWATETKRTAKKKSAAQSYISQAIRDYSKCIHLNPSNYLLYLYRGRLLLKLSFMKEATNDFHAAFELNSGIAQTFVQRALVLSFQRKYQQIIDESSKKSKFELNHDASLNMLVAKARMKCGDPMGALQDLQRALQISRDDPHIHLQRGICYESLKDFKKAVAEFSKCLNIDANFAK
ncbi:cytochrome c oxidase subunit 1, partial [Quaeritorhiza haematococci]